MKLKLGFLLLGIYVAVFSCKQDELVEATNEDSSNSSKFRVAATVRSTSTTSFTRSDAKYTQSMADTDFGNFDSDYFTKDNAYNRSNELRVRIPSNTRAGKEGTRGSGFRGDIDVADGTSYRLTYKIKFDSNFKWSRGGKCGFGIIIGEGLSGCGDVTGRGASLRLMWYSPKNEYGKTPEDSYAYFHPYLYTSKKVDGECGTDFDTKYENIKKNTWYTVEMTVTSNSGSNANGKVLVKINGTEVLNKNNILWTTNDSYRKITKVNTNNFRGGSSDYWMADTDGYIYYDDVKFERLAN
ncbi:MAG: hypothetical protein MUF58_10880 [Arcicella sp.]|jgi:hypothetical protein|nr:hypothetical protein [Arcicella sp.]